MLCASFWRMRQLSITSIGSFGILVVLLIGAHGYGQPSSPTITASCSEPGDPATPVRVTVGQQFTLQMPVAESPPPAATRFTDPFAYCAAVGTIDTPDSRYAGPKVPEAVARGLQRA